MSKLITNPVDYCQTHYACSEGRKFATKYTHMADVWDNCTNLNWLFWMIRRLDDPGPIAQYRNAVVAACERILPLVRAAHHGSCVGMLMDMRMVIPHDRNIGHDRWKKLRDDIEVIDYDRLSVDWQAALVFSRGYGAFDEGVKIYGIVSNTVYTLIQLQYVLSRAPVSRWWHVFTRESRAAREVCDLVRTHIPNPFR